MSVNLSDSMLNNTDEQDFKFRNIADAPVMIRITNLEKSGEWFNKRWTSFTGRTLEQELGIGWTEGVHPEDLQRYLAQAEIAYKTPQVFSIEYRLMRFDGVYRWVTESASPDYDNEGQFYGFTAWCTDIQDNKDLNQSILDKSAELENSVLQLQQNSERAETRKRLYETILSATPDFVYTFEFGDESHRFGYANDGLLKMFGRSYEETVGKTFLEIGYEPWHAELHNKEIDIVRRTKKELRGEIPFNGTYGRRIYDYIFSPVFDSEGEVEAVAGITRDVTERHNTEEKLKSNEEALVQASKRKDEFLAMLAHELRNPLAPISAATQIMTLSNYEESKVRKFSQVIDRQVKHLVELVDDLLDVSRVTRGLVEIEKSPQDIKSIIASSIEQVRPLLEIKHHQLNLNLASEPAIVLGDHKRLIQIISNVLNNAAKYTHDNGRISLEMKIENESVIIKITDNGIGILKEDQDAIYELFAQAKRSSDRSQGGLGIGLALVRSMLKLHDGAIACHSDGLGKGSQFTISLPLVAAQKKILDKPGQVQPNENSLTIVVVDDNIDAANTIAALLSLEGHEVIVEHDSEKALEIIISTLPRVCILDIGLPKMDGNELAKRIKATPATSSAVLIAVTGYGQEIDKKLAMESGFNHHLVKPVDFEKLQEILKNLDTNLEKPS